MTHSRSTPLRGRALVQHMIDVHGFVTWNPPKPNTREYRRWKQSHALEYHGRWASQQDHTHTLDVEHGDPFDNSSQ